MSTRWSIAQLPWLPEPPVDFRAQCRSLSGGPAEELVGRLCTLSGCRLDANHLFLLSKAAHRLLPADGPMVLSPLQSIRLAFVCNSTASMIAPAIAATGLRYGLRIDVCEHEELMTWR